MTKAATTCKTEPLEAGSYVVYHGDELVTENLVVPSEASQGCFF